MVTLTVFIIETVSTLKRDNTDGVQRFAGFLQLMLANSAPSTSVMRSLGIEGDSLKHNTINNLFKSIHQTCNNQLYNAHNGH